jgi:hypothetical protein
MKRRAFVGLGLGLSFALFQFIVLGIAESYLHTSPPAIGRTFDILNAPADAICRFWSNGLQLPPRGEAAWVVAPVVTIPLQWGFIGLMGGLCWGSNVHRRRAKETAVFGQFFLSARDL